MASRLRLILAAVQVCGVWACLAPAPVSAQAQTQTPLADPTRPPAGVLDPATAEDTAGGRVLQSVLIPRQGKPLAVIDGQLVRLGQRYGDARLIRVNEREVVLDGPEGIERLQLTPGIEKTNIRTDNVTKGAKRAPARRSVRNEG